MLRRLLFAPQWLLEVMLAFEGRYGNTVLLNGSAALQVEIRFPIVIETFVFGLRIPCNVEAS